MYKRIRTRLRNLATTVFVPASAMVVMGFSNNVLATSCWLDAFVDTAFVRAQSDLIFTGTVIARSEETFEHADLSSQETIVSEKTTFKIETVDKGGIVAGENILVEMGAECSCAGKFSVGKKYLVYARFEEAGEKWILQFCSFNREVQ